MNNILLKYSKLIIIFIILINISLKIGASDVLRTERNYLYRLPKNIIPTDYELWLYPHLKLSNFSYEGRVVINLRVESATNLVTLNAEGLRIVDEKTRIILDNNENHEIKIISQTYDAERQFFAIALDEYIEPENYTLDLSFIGDIRDDVFGFYRSAAKTGNKTRWMAITQFSPTYARAAFPCFDEPWMRATFKLHLGHYDDETATSNTESESEELTNIPNYHVTTFQRSPSMSTYLFGWSVHTFKYDPVFPNFGIWTRPSMLGRGHKTLEKGQLIYSALSAWMNISSPIVKIEHIAVPDFHFSAMENWGMITFRESIFLYENNVTPVKFFYNGLTTMAHEYAHSWFGNLVTPEFWTMAWIKEGFATYFSYLSRSLVFTDIKVMDLFVVENLQDALLLDAERHLRTMNAVDVGERNSSLSIMDFAPYKKGSSVIRMIERMMGMDHFQMAMRSYLRDRSFTYATPTILYSHLEKYPQGLATKINFSEVIESYANQPGYPLVTITRNYSTNRIEITQERFYQNPDYAYLNDSRWWIPLSLASQSTLEQTAFGEILLKKADKKIIIYTAIDNKEWIICDLDKSGYYRTNYDQHNWHLLSEYLVDEWPVEIGPVARATLVDDAFNLARGGYINYSIPFNLIRYLANETAYEPWLAATNSFNFLSKMLQELPVLKDNLKDYAKRLLTPIYQSLTLPGSNDNQWGKVLRQLIQSSACTMGNEDCLNTSNWIFRKWIGNPREWIDPDTKSFVYCVGIRKGNGSDWEEVFERLHAADLHTEKELLIWGLGCSDNRIFIDKFLEFMMHNGPELPKQYRLMILNSVLSGNKNNVAYALQYLSKNIQRIVDLRGSSFLLNVIKSIAGSITSATNLQMFLSIVENNVSLLGPSAGTVDKAIADAQARLAWIQKYAPMIEKSLAQL